MRKVITIGELLIDFLPEQKGLHLKDVNSFIKKPGGAPANVAVAAAKLGCDSYFIGQVGHDGFGDFLIEQLKSYHVNTSLLFQTKKAPTALAFVSLDMNGDRDFIFYRNPSADQLLNHEGLDLEKFGKDILHFCSVSLDDYPIKDTHHYVIQQMKEKGAFISFDPNLRLSLFKDHLKLKNTILEFMHYADILKVSEDEIEFITGLSNEEKAIEFFFRYDIKYLIITRGSNGVTLYTKDQRYDIDGLKVEVKDTTGAGDAFIGAFLSKLAEDDITVNNESEKIKEYLIFANQVAAVTTTKLGAMDAIPLLEELE